MEELAREFGVLGGPVLDGALVFSDAPGGGVQRIRVEGSGLSVRPARISLARPI